MNKSFLIQKSIKRIKMFIVLLALIGVSKNVNSQTIVDQGICGSGNLWWVTWILTSDSVLTIYGDGVMYDFDIFNPYSLPPWYSGYRSDIKEVIIGDSITHIGDNAFWDCNNLIAVTIGEKIKTIGNNVFWGCDSLHTVNYNSINCISVGYGNMGLGSVFSFCPVFTTLNIGNKVKTIPDNAFVLCRLDSVIIPNNVTTIGIQSFLACGLTSVTLPDSLTSIGANAFGHCFRLHTVNYNAINCIMVGFNGWSLFGPFEDCPVFMTLNIGNQVKNISHFMFYNCNSLTSITSLSITPPMLGYFVFNNVPSNIPVYIPCLTYDSYSKDSVWNYFTNFVINGHTDTTFYTAVKCYNVPYTDQDFTTPIDSAGIYYITLVNSANCDSVICLTLTEIPHITNYSATICQGTFYTDDNFTNLTHSGVYYDTLQNLKDCDSIIELTLIVDSAYFMPIAARICVGMSYDFFGKTLITGGVYLDTLQTVNGCDSVIELTLSVDSFLFIPITKNICENTTYFFKNEELSVSGIYYDTLRTICGCDSIIELTLIVNSVHFTTIIKNICQGETYNENGFNESVSGIYTQNSHTIFGCDSTIILDLTVNPVYFTKISDSISAGSFYNFNGKQLNISGVYYDTLQTINSCDSTIELTLTITSVGIVEILTEKSPIVVYPNPAFMQLHVKFDTPEVANYSISSITGQILLQGKVQNNSPINIESLASGMYYLKIAGKTVKFVKE